MNPLLMSIQTLLLHSNREMARRQIDPRLCAIPQALRYPPIPTTGAKLTFADAISEQQFTSQIYLIPFLMSVRLRKCNLLL